MLRTTGTSPELRENYATAGDTGGVITRVATVEDAAAIAHIHVRTWQQAYRGLLPQEFLDSIDTASRTLGWRRSIAAQHPPTQACLVLADSEQILGFAHICPTRDDDAENNAVGEVTSIYLRPDAWGRGLGHQLMDGALDRLREAGNIKATLWVLQGNTRAIHFSTVTGWSHDGVTKEAIIAHTAVTEARYRKTL